MRRAPFNVRYHYQHNQLYRLSDREAHDPTDETQSYWCMLAQDAAGRVTRDVFGNGVETTYTFDNEGCAFRYSNLTAIQSPVQDLAYEYYPDGNVSARTALNKHQAFTYDALQRLRTITTSDATTERVEETQSLDYSDIGNIENRSDVGRYYYAALHGFQPHAVTRVIRLDGDEEHYTYDSAGYLETIERPGKRIDITKNSFGKPSRIDVNGEVLEFEYDALQNRIRKWSTAAETRYLDSLTHIQFFDDATDHQVYCYDLGNFEVVWDQRDEAATRLVRYKHLDHLGSLNVISDATGAASEPVFFDSFGLARQESFIGPPTDLSPWGSSNHGYTGHEHDEDFGLGLINTGGRLYDPKLGRFTSPDAIIKSPANGQSHNAYSYVLNNPTTYTDPTGFEVHYGGGVCWPDSCGTGPSMNFGSFGSNSFGPGDIGSFGHGSLGSLGPIDLGTLPDGANVHYTFDNSGLSSAQARPIPAFVWTGHPLIDQDINTAVYWLATPAGLQEFRPIAAGYLVYALSLIPARGSDAPDTVGPPGFWDGMIPFYGSGRDLVNDVQNERYGWVVFDGVMLVGDVFLVKAVVEGVVRGVVVGVGRRSMVSSGFRRLPGPTPWSAPIDVSQLTRTQRRVLERLPMWGDRTFAASSNFKFRDLVALSRATRDEFAMLSRDGLRMVIRGTPEEIPALSTAAARHYSEQGWRFTGHTHFTTVLPSAGDRNVLRAFGHRTSVVVVTDGAAQAFTRRGPIRRIVTLPLP